MTPQAPLRVYLDEDVDVLLAALLGGHGIDCLTTVAAGNLRRSDEEQLTFAWQQSRVIVTHNRTDFENRAVAWWGQQRQHAGIVMAARRADSYDLLRHVLPVLQLYDQAGGATRRSTLEFARRRAIRGPQMHDSRPDLQCMRRMVQDKILVESDVDRQIALEAIRAFENLPSEAAPSSDCLDALVAATASTEGHVGCVGAELLNLLAINHESAREAIRLLQAGGNENTRFWAISAATWEPIAPNSFVEEILRRGLADESPKNRTHAAYTVARFGLSQLLPEMKLVRDGITDPDDAYWMDLYMDLTRDGYSLEPVSAASMAQMVNSDGTPQFVEPMCWIKIRIDNSHGGLIGGIVKEKDIRTRGGAAVAHELAEKHKEEERKRPAPNADEPSIVRPQPRPKSIDRRST